MKITNIKCTKYTFDIDEVPYMWVCYNNRTYFSMQTFFATAESINYILNFEPNDPIKSINIFKKLQIL